jgi:hypothetical protein
MSPKRLLVVVALVLAAVTLMPMPVAWPVAPLPVAVFCLALSQLM